MSAAAVLVAVAVAYADDPLTLDALLRELAEAEQHRAHAAGDPRATDYGRELAAAACDRAGEDLAAVLDLPESNGATL
ncbi:hypothetical protein [Streptomyces sp. NPDC047070]|uniref:hypothetical protein n=1 Tax=Streptomyces sp. NPDC047070 TaxID=3154923 RepID=UPI0034536B19